MNYSLWLFVRFFDLLPLIGTLILLERSVPWEHIDVTQKSLKMKLSTCRSLVMGVSEIAQNLGVNYKTLYNWVKNAMSQAPSTQAGKDKVKALEAEIKSLKRELTFTRQESEILTKAVAYFASQKS